MCCVKVVIRAFNRDQMFFMPKMVVGLSNIIEGKFVFVVYNNERLKQDDYKL